jgi:hypothetical protein
MAVSQARRNVSRLGQRSTHCRGSEVWGLRLRSGRSGQKYTSIEEEIRQELPDLFRHPRGAGGVPRCG